VAAEDLLPEFLGLVQQMSGEGSPPIRLAYRPRLAFLWKPAAVLLAIAAVVTAGVSILLQLAAAGVPPGGMALMLAALAGAAFLLARRRRRRLPGRMVLELELVSSMPEEPGGAPWQAGAGALTLLETIELLGRAGTDPRVGCLLARIGHPASGLAQVQELHEAVRAFRATGKRTIAFAETLGDGGPASGAYYLASAFDEIILQPSGDVGLTGVAIESTFLRGALDKLGIDPRLDHRHEYKAAKNLLTERGFTPAHREAATAIVGSLLEQVVAGVASGRSLPPERVRELAAQGPLFAPEALAAGLVDRLGYRDEAQAEALHLAGPGADIVDLRRYQRACRSHRRAPVIAVVYGTGQVMSGESRTSPLSRRRTMGSETLRSAFETAAKDRRVRAIVFRIDSPGGSYVASDVIWRAVGTARSSGKPLVVSMGNLAGSGGYLVALAGDRILASPATLTGSIGVIAGKPVIAGLAAKLGVTTEEVSTHSSATSSSIRRDYTEPEWQRLQAFLDRAYVDFLEKVSAGRGMALEQVAEVARGRVWTGEQALNLGLIDELGGIAAALRQAKETIGLAATSPARLAILPRRPLSPVARLLERTRAVAGLPGGPLGPGSASEAALSLAGAVLDDLGLSESLTGSGVGRVRAEMPPVRLVQ
ncbi:MAG: signal peptide peptidase SppA, partial [Acidimicrobiia bacterium]